MEELDDRKVKVSVTYSCGGVTLIGILFILLKALGIVNWSWTITLAPFLLVIAFVLITSIATIAAILMAESSKDQIDSVLNKKSELEIVKPKVAEEPKKEVAKETVKEKVKKATKDGKARRRTSKKNEQNSK